MNNNYEIEHPGLVFQEKLQEIGMSVKEFAIRAGKPEKTIIEVIKGYSSITPQMALLIEYVTGMSADMLLAWQAQFDAWQARVNRETMMEDISEWLSKLPVSNIIANGWVVSQTSDLDLADSMLRFYGVASLDAWKNYYFGQKLKVAFNVSIEKAVDPYALSAWLRRGELQASEIVLYTVYSSKALKKKLPEIRMLLQNPPDDVMPMLRRLLAEVGVKLFYTEPLPSVPVNGATRWIGGFPCIQLLNTTGAYEDYARTVFHEIGHILLHGRKDVFLENIGVFFDNPDILRKEAEADAFVKKYLG